MSFIRSFIHAVACGSAHHTSAPSLGLSLGPQLSRTHTCHPLGSIAESLAFTACPPESRISARRASTAHAHGAGERPSAWHAKSNRGFHHLDNTPASAMHAPP